MKPQSSIIFAEIALAPVLTGRTAARVTMAGVSPNVPSDPNGIHIEITDDCRGEGKTRFASRPRASTLSPMECATKCAN